MNGRLTFYVTVVCENQGEIIAEYEAEIGHRIDGVFPNLNGDDGTDECQLCADAAQTA
ncbi:hypothetical protein [Nocardiopsis suaedae]|uniref:Uncharacterized protein n=1 Tax=Nocardiopsis suaedae TaxID=3018444 RepID=A0ABT4TIP1_9ACTN|nr:hypothetical protein [Nocardiopsis suaedae]MDA2804572.1 hypothetical protein [Nocardiopsis suaedae]